jgi:hypothetical protein
MKAPFGAAIALAVFAADAGEGVLWRNRMER